MNKPKSTNGKACDLISHTRTINSKFSFPIDKWDFKIASVFRDLPAEDLELLMANSTEQIYHKGEIIFRENSFPTGIFFVKQGMIKKYKTDIDGKEQIIYVANKGELIGYHALLAEERYPDSASPLENSRIVFIPREDFLHTLQRSDVLSKRLLKTLSHEFAVLINSISVFTQKSVRERLALQLIILSEKYKNVAAPDMPVEINMSRSDLASLVGTARENVVRLLSELKQQDIISIRGRKIILYDKTQLLRIADFR